MSTNYNSTRDPGFPFSWITRLSDKLFGRAKFSLTQHDEICQNPASKGASQKIQASINFAFASVAQLMRELLYM